MGMFGALKKAVAPINRAVGKAPGMNKLAGAVNKVPGMGAMGRGLGIGPSRPPTNVGQPMGPNEGPTSIGQPQGPMNQAINPNASAMGRMAQGFGQMAPQMQPKPMGPMDTYQTGGGAPPPSQFIDGPPQPLPPMPQGDAGQADPRAQMMARNKMMQGQAGGIGPSMMGRGRGQFGSYRQ